VDEVSGMGYTVKQLSDMAGVSPRTLHYYDEIGLLKPANYGTNGYRYYDDKAALRLQQILFFKELDFKLEEIQAIMDSPVFDLVDALQTHKTALQQRVTRLNQLIHTVDQTIQHVKGERAMSEQELFDGFSEEQQQAYAKEAEQRWGDEVVQSNKLWNSYPAEKKARIIAEGKAIYQDLKALMVAGKGPDSREVQAIIGRWHAHLRYFYEPSVERLRGLSELYINDPAFAANFRKIHPELPEFLQRAIPYYCDHLDTSA
jgi:DNA-binding transcriptional MerR regulator